MSINVCPGTLLERLRLRLFERSARPLCGARLDRVFAFVEQLVLPVAQAARLVERDYEHGPEPHLARLGVEHEAKDPRLGARGADLEIEPRAIRVVARLALGLHATR